MMIPKQMLTVILVLGLTCAASAQGLRKTGSTGERVSDAKLGISFARVGSVAKADSSTYRIQLQPSGHSGARSAFAEVSASDRLFVDLPGSYGGKMYLDKSQRARVLKNRVMADTVDAGGLVFTREYWTVYCGMGMWEGVINCYTEKSGTYFVVSMVQDGPFGKPGEIINGEPLTSAQIRQKVLFSLQDTTDQSVQAFNKLIASVEIVK